MTIDLSLVQLAQSGDQDAYAKLYAQLKRRLSPVVGNFCRNKAGIVDYEDTLADCVTQVLMNLHQFKGDSSFVTWATRVALNECLTAIRRYHASNRKPVNGFQFLDAIDPETGQSPNIPDPRNDYRAVEDMLDLKKIIDKQTPKVKLLLEEKYILGKKHAEQSLPLSLSAYKSASCRALFLAQKTYQELSAPPL
jgi:RNA polymerase sigma-70 factor (ECF subfamily)